MNQLGKHEFQEISLDTNFQRFAITEQDQKKKIVFISVPKDKTEKPVTAEQTISDLDKVIHAVATKEVTLSKDEANQINTFIERFQEKMKDSSNRSGTPPSEKQQVMGRRGVPDL